MVIWRKRFPHTHHALRIVPKFWLRKVETCSSSDPCSSRRSRLCNWVFKCIWSSKIAPFRTIELTFLLCLFLNERKRKIQHSLLSFGENTFPWSAKRFDCSVESPRGLVHSGSEINRGPPSFIWNGGEEDCAPARDHAAIDQRSASHRSPSLFWTLWVDYGV